MRRALALLGLPTVAILALAAPSVAAPPHAGTATLTYSAADTSAALTSPTVGTPLVFSGCGYQAGVGVTVTVQSPTALSFFGAVAGPDGCFSTATTSTYTPTTVGSYTASSYQSSKKRADATVTFTVTG